jgi:tyrosine-protein phosphatase 2/3
MDVPSLIDKTPLMNVKSPPSSPSTTKKFLHAVNAKHTAVDATTRLALECKDSPLFTSNSTSQVPGAQAFFSNIRQNMDLHGGVGPLIPINAPSIPPSIQSRLPKWLSEVAFSSNGAEILARRWETIELAEKRRLESTLTGDGMQGRFSISAAMERGEKNRYPNIWPFEWNRVKIPQAIEGQDYFNGSYVQTGQGKRRYIVTQAPVPATFEDFWKVIWGEGVQVILCLTAEQEGGQVYLFR